MTIAELNGLMASRGLSITGYRQGAGRFRDLEIGVGSSYADLAGIVRECKEAGHTMAAVTSVSNREHPDFGKMYAEIGSFWWE